MSGDAECVRRLPPLHSAYNLVTATGKRESSAKFETAVPMKPYIAENGQYGPLLTVECRGLEFTGFDPRVGISVAKNSSSA